jgi:integrase
MTTRNIVQALRGFLVDVRGKGWVNLRENPLLDPYVRKVLGVPDTVAGRNTIIHLTKDQVRQLISCEAAEIPPFRKVRNLVAIATGCRLGEIRAWTWTDFDLDSPMPTVRVFKQVQFTGPDGEPIAKDPKRHSHRVIPLHPSSVKALRWWRATGWREYVGRDSKPDDPVFPSPSGDYATSRAPDLFRADLETAKLPKLFDGKHPFTFHAIRRTFMSLLEAEGVPRELIGALKEKAKFKTWLDVQSGEMYVEAEVGDRFTLWPFEAENYGLMYDYATRDEQVSEEVRELIQKGQGSFVFNEDGFINCVVSGPARSLAEP